MHNHQEHCSCQQCRATKIAAPHSHKKGEQHVCGCGEGSAETEDDPPHSHGREESCSKEHCHAAGQSRSTAGHSEGDGCDCGHNHGGAHAFSEWWLLAGGVAALAISILPVKLAFWPFAFSLIAILLPGWTLFVRGIKAAIRFQMDELFLLTVAVAAAFLIGEFREAVLVTLLFRLGQILEDRAVAKSRRQIEALTAIRPDSANLKNANGGYDNVDARNVSLGSEIQIRPGERVPLDCIVESGVSTADCASITGESLPVEVRPGDSLPASAVNGGGLLVCRTTSSFSDSSASRIIALVEQSAAKKGQTEAFITRFARIYTPLVLVFAAMLAFLPPLFGMGPLGMWVSRALVFLVASCPCALVISVPLAFYAGIGAASQKGVIIKGSKFIERLSRLSCAVFDKTGTLTSGNLSLGRTQTANGWSREDVLHLASVAERDSLHPIARAIAAHHDTLPPHEAHRTEDFAETSGHGVSLMLDGRAVLCGSRRYLSQHGVDVSALDGLSAYLSVDGVLAGGLELGDQPREDAAHTLQALRDLGVAHTVMLTGDNPASAKRIAQATSIDEFYASLLPQDKVDRLESCKQKYGVTLFTGDGINDAPVLAGADIGCAMGLGTDAAIEAADLVLLSDRLSSLPDALKIAKRTMSIARFNIAFALAVKAVVLLMGALGLAQMWMAVFADVGVSIIAVLNAVRLLSSSKLPLEKKNI